MPFTTRVHCKKSSEDPYISSVIEETFWDSFFTAAAMQCHRNILLSKGHSEQRQALLGHHPAVVGSDRWGVNQRWAALWRLRDAGRTMARALLSNDFPHFVVDPSTHLTPIAHPYLHVDLRCS